MVCYHHLVTLPPSVANVIKLGPENISGERINYLIYQITDCCSRSGNCLLYGMPCGDLTRMFPPANLHFVQSPSACFDKSSTVRFLLTIKIRSCFIRSLEFARVNNSAALTDAKLSLDVFEKLSTDLVLMSAIQSVITFPAFSPYKSSSPDSPTLYGFFAVNRNFDIGIGLDKLKESRQECNIPGQISFVIFGRFDF